MFLRDDIKKLAAGNYLMTNLNGVDREKMVAYVDGALFFFDFLEKNKTLKFQQPEFKTEQELTELVRQDDAKVWLGAEATNITTKVN